MNPQLGWQENTTPSCILYKEDLLLTQKFLTGVLIGLLTFAISREIIQQKTTIEINKLMWVRQVKI
jgi:hypothetical protein